MSSIKESQPDICGSIRYLCCCGTHFNSDPLKVAATNKWLLNHWQCNTVSLTDKQEKIHESRINEV